MLNQITRGGLIDRHGAPLAYDDLAMPGEARRYTEATLGHIIGYTSSLRVGVTGLERSYNGTLFGLDQLQAQFDRLLHNPTHGADLSLTIDAGLQQQAAQALGGRRGAVLILDGHSGAVLAMVSQPAFDPNRMLDPEYTAALLQSCDVNDCPAPLLNRVLQGRYTPGSTWKTVTLIAGLDSGQLKPGMMFDFGKPVSGPNGSYYVYRVDGGVIPDPNHKENRLSLEMSYAKSANAAFARIGDEMPAQTLIAAAQRLGMGEDQSAFPFDMPSAAPQIAYNLDELSSNNLLRASTAIGQGQLLVTPLSMARVALAVVNDGRMPLPYVVDSIHHSTGRTDAGPIKGRWSEALMQPETARQVRAMMQTVVEKGSGFKARLPGITVGGKTGTAQVAEGQPHAWFIGYAEQGERLVVMVVLVEHGGEGSMTAAPIFAALAPAALNAAGTTIAPPVDWASTGGQAGQP
jgi:peptidoglycan glycosyltransferase